MHCHVDLNDSMIQYCKNAKENNIKLLSVTNTPKAYITEKKLFLPYDNVLLATGLHPQLISTHMRELDLLLKTIDSSKYIGEVGLDFSKRFYKYKDQQIKALEIIINKCSILGNKVISIHSVYSVNEIIRILDKTKVTNNNYCIFHWYSGNKKHLKEAINMGCYFSINKAMLNSKTGIDCIKEIPLERILVETDMPFINDSKTFSLIDDLLLCSKKLTEIKGEYAVDTINNNSEKILFY